MYVGYISIGADDPFNSPPSESVEVLNNERAYAYARNAGLCWVEACDECPDAVIVVPGGPTFVSPILDPAPWYDEEDPDTWGFLGVIGLEVSGASDSTRQSEVTMSLSGTGVIGPQYMAPREMTVRAIVIATDDCCLERGLIWLRQQFVSNVDPCGGDPMTFFDCCPCVCSSDEPGLRCWGIDYDELTNTPDCALDAWWPSTYQELVDGPPAGVDTEETFCSWVRTYYELGIGPPDWTCCVDACVVPYMRQFYDTRVVTGPTILRRPALHSPGAVAEVEFLITAADPVPHGALVLVARQWMGAESQDHEDPAPPAPRSDPFGRRATAVLERPVQPWVRQQIDVDMNRTGRWLSAVTPRLRLWAREATGRLRLGLWAGDQLVAGWSVPYLPSGVDLFIEGGKVWTLIDGERDNLPVFVRSFHDDTFVRHQDVPHGVYRLTLDQHPDDVVEVLVELSAIPVGA